jgi:hypothetical protein
VAGADLTVDTQPRIEAEVRAKGFAEQSLPVVVAARQLCIGVRVVPQARLDAQGRGRRTAKRHCLERRRGGGRAHACPVLGPAADEQSLPRCRAPAGGGEWIRVGGRWQHAARHGRLSARRTAAREQDEHSHAEQAGRTSAHGNRERDDDQDCRDSEGESHPGGDRRGRRGHDVGGA